MSADRLGRLGALIGLGMSSAYAAWLLVVQTGPGKAGLIPALGLGLGYVAPFVVALVALRVREANRRVALWMGCGVLGLLLSITSVAGVTLPLFAPAVILFVAGFRLHREAHSKQTPVDAGVTMGLILLGTASVLIVRVLGDELGAALGVIGWAMVAAWLAAMLSANGGGLEARP
jgi:hypothetical protein